MPREDWLEALIAAEPDLTLEEIPAERGRSIRVAASSVWRFCERPTSRSKKSLHAAEQDRAGRARGARELEARAAAA